MAKTSTSALVRMAPPRVSAPIIRVSAPRAAPKKKHHRRRGGGGGARSKSQVMAIAVAGAALGYIDKGTLPIPTIPILGRAGTIAAAIYFLGPKGAMWTDAMIAAAAVAGYELGSKGSISGNVAGGLASQI